MEGAALLVPMAAISAVRRWNVRQGAADDLDLDRAREEPAQESPREEPSAWPNLLHRSSCGVRKPEADRQSRGVFQKRDIGSLSFSKMALDIQSFVTEAVANMSGAASDESESEVPPEDQAAALQALCEFCEGYGAVRVEPTHAELQALWERCSGLHPSAVAAAICEQLSWGNGTSEWQQKLRSLCALEHFAGIEGAGHEAAVEACSEAQDIVEHLASEVPQCRDVAARILASLSGSFLREAPSAAASAERLFRVDNTELASRTTGLAWRLQKKRKSKDSAVQGPRWGTTVRGVDLGDGWVRVGGRYLPVKLGGKQVLFELDEAEAEAAEAEPQPQPQLPEVSQPAPAELETELDAEDGPAPSSPWRSATGPSQWKAAFPAPATPSAPVGLLEEPEEVFDLAGLDFSEGVVAPLAVEEAMQALAPRTKSRASPATSPSQQQQQQQMSRYLWLSAVETAVPQRPDPFRFASDAAFSAHHGVPVFAL